MCAASTGRRHDRTRPPRQIVRFLLPRGGRPDMTRFRYCWRMRVSNASELYLVTSRLRRGHPPISERNGNTAFASSIENGSIPHLPLSLVQQGPAARRRGRPTRRPVQPLPRPSSARGLSEQEAVVAGDRDRQLQGQLRDARSLGRASAGCRPGRWCHCPCITTGRTPPFAVALCLTARVRAR